MIRLERTGLAAGVLLLVVLPIAWHGWPTDLPTNLSLLLIVVAGLALSWWRTHPRVASVTALGGFLVALVLGRDLWFPDTGAVLFSLCFLVLALGWSGRAAALAALCGLAYLVPFYLLTGEQSWVATLMFTVPPFAVGTLLRLRRETSEQLARRAQELDEERELYAEIALRHERGKIAGELHDIVGHAISVMVIQAAAGQRLAATDPARAKETLAAISESARQGTRDLERLVELLGGSASDVGTGMDLSLVEELVGRASRSGLAVTCRLEGDRDAVPPPVAHVAFRVVQESLTNALRHAPGSQVRIVVRAEDTGLLAVRVENDRPAHPGAQLEGTGQGLLGLRERVQQLGGQFSAGRTGQGWTVEALLPAG